MKRSIICLLLLFLFLPGICIAENTDHMYSDARGTADFMQEHYGIKILIGPECDGITNSSFSLGHSPIGRTPLFDTAGMFSYSEEIKIIDDAFSVYPPGFFEHFVCKAAPKGLRILLADQISTEKEKHMAGVTTAENGYYNIFLGVGAFSDANVHHEIWHAMELRIAAGKPEAFEGWDRLNPEGFTYSKDYASPDPREIQEAPEDWFALKQGMISAGEDRATIFEEVWRRDEAWWQEHPQLQKKLSFMLEAARPIFGEVY